MKMLEQPVAVESCVESLDRRFGQILLEINELHREEELPSEFPPTYMRTLHGQFKIGDVDGRLYASFSNTGRVKDVSIKILAGRKPFVCQTDFLKVVKSSDFVHGASAEALSKKIVHAEADHQIVVWLLKRLLYEVSGILLGRLRAKAESSMSKGKQAQLATL